MCLPRLPLIYPQIWKSMKKKLKEIIISLVIVFSLRRRRFRWGRARFDTQIKTALVSPNTCTSSKHTRKYLLGIGVFPEFAGMLTVNVRNKSTCFPRENHTIWDGTNLDSMQRETSPIQPCSQGLRLSRQRKDPGNEFAPLQATLWVDVFLGDVTRWKKRKHLPV